MRTFVNNSACHSGPNISRRRLLQTAAGGTAVGTAGCLGSSATQDQRTGHTITDGLGRQVTVPETVEAVVGVGPGALRQIAYLGAIERVIGVEQMDDSLLSATFNLAYPELHDRPIIGSAGSGATGNSEEILALDPDVIFFNGQASQADTLQSQTDTPVVGLSLADFVDADARETVFSTWRLIGSVLGVESRADELVAFVQRTIEALEARTADLPSDSRERAYVGAISYKGPQGLRTTRIRFPPFQWTGVENVAGAVSASVPSISVSIEELLAWDPETVFVSVGNLERARSDARSNPEYGDIDALRTGETYSILPHATYYHEYGSVFANAYFIGKIMYPDLFSDISLRGRTNEIFEQFLGTGLYDDLHSEYPMFQRGILR